MQSSSLPELINEVIHQEQKLLKLETNTDQVSTYFVGLTGSAKTSLICYLLGLEIEHKKKSNEKYVITNKDSDIPLVIGNTHESCTDIPCGYQLDGMTLYDTPGFFDTKGFRQEILNSYFLAKMWKKGNQIKIVLVVEQATFQVARGGAFVSIIRRLYELFDEDFAQMMESCMLVISKVDTKSKKYKKQNVIATIKKIADTNNAMNNQCQRLINSMIQKQRILIFPFPNLIKSTLISEIKKSIQNLAPFQKKKDAQISLTSEAKEQIQKLSHSLLAEIDIKARQLGDLIFLEQAILRVYFIAHTELPLYSCIKRLLQEILNAKSLINTRQAGVYFEKIFEIFNIDSQINIQLKDLLKKVQFCKTFYKDVEATTKISEILMISLTECQQKHQELLDEIIKAERIQQMEREEEQRRRQHEQRMQMQRIQHEREMRRRRQEAQAIIWQNRQRHEREMERLERLNLLMQIMTILQYNN